jgi:hypothetical protein
MSNALWIPSGIVVWALHFGALYGFTALACARDFAGAVPWFAGAATLAAIVAAGLILARGLRRRGDFAGWMTLAVAAFALAAILFQAIPLFIVPACA